MITVGTEDAQVSTATLASIAVSSQEGDRTNLLTLNVVNWRKGEFVLFEIVRNGEVIAKVEAPLSEQEIAALKQIAPCIYDTRA